MTQNFKKLLFDDLMEVSFNEYMDYFYHFSDGIFVYVSGNSHLIEGYLNQIDGLNETNKQAAYLFINRKVNIRKENMTYMQKAIRLLFGRNLNAIFSEDGANMENDCKQYLEIYRKELAGRMKFNDLEYYL